MTLWKAFYTVNDAGIFSKLLVHRGIVGRELRWLVSYLLQIKCFVLFDRVRIEDESIIVRAPPGSIVGPLILSLVMNIFLPLKKSRSII